MAKIKQMTLFKVVEEEIEQEPKKRYKTDFFKIQTSAGAIDKFIEKLDAGRAPKSDDEKMALKRDWIQSKMRPCTDSDITGDQYYISKNSLFNQIFGDDE